MAKNWWFKFEYRVWQSDPALSQCSLAARGFWLEVLCSMYAQETHTVTGSFERIARMTRCESSEVAKFSLELKEANVCDVTLGHGDVTLKSRRLKRELTTKESNRLRKQKERGHTNVTPQSNKSEVISNKQEENPLGFSAVDNRGFLSGRKGIPRTLTPINPILNEELNVWLDAIAPVLGAKNRHTMADAKRWESMCMKAMQEERDLGEVLDVIKSELSIHESRFVTGETVLKKLQTKTAPKAKFVH